MNPTSRVFAYLVGVAFAVVLIPWLATFVTALDAATTTARAAVANRLEVVGSGITRDIEAYLALGVRMEDAVGVDQYLANELRAEDDIRVALVTASNGKVLGRYVRSGQSGTADQDAIDERANWSALGLQTISFPISYRGAVVATALLAYDTSASVGKVRAMAANFVAILVIILAVAFEAILYVYRDTVIMPLSTAVALDRRAAERSFDRIAAPPQIGPLVPLIEAQNRLILGINDRFARVRAFLAEIREVSFNRRAAIAVDKVSHDLDKVGRFAPDGLDELQLDHGDLFAGPMAFVCGILIGIAGTLSANALSTVGNPWAEGLAAEAVLAGLVAAGVLVGATRGARVGAGTVLAAIGLALLAALPGRLIIVGTALVAMGVAVEGSMLATTRPVAAAERVLHAAAGCGVGGVLIAVDSGPGFHWATYVAAAILLALVATIAMRHGAASRRAARATAAMSLRHPRQFAMVLPSWLAWITIGYWLAASDPAGSAIGDTASHAGMSVWLTAFLLAAGGCLALAGLGGWKPRHGDGIAISSGCLVLLLLAFGGRGVAFTGGGSAIAGLATGVAMMGAAMASRRYSGGIALPAAIGLTVGVTAGLLSVAGEFGNVNLFLLIASATVAAALVVLASAWRHDPGAAGRGAA